MDTKTAKVLDNGVPFVNSKRKQLDRGTINSARSIRLLLPQRSSPTFTKRRKLSNSKHGSGAFPSGKCLLKYYSNFKKSGILQRLMYYYNDQWNDFSSDIVTAVNKDFIIKKAAVEVELNGNMILLDFLQMLLLDMDTGLHQPIAWIDVSGKCFFPEIFSHGDESFADEGYNEIGAETQVPTEINLNLEIEIQKLDYESSGESVPIVVNVQAHENAEDCGDEFDVCERTSDLEIDENCENDINRKFEGNMNLAVNSGDVSLNSDAIRELFFGAIGSRAAKIIETRPCTSIIMKGRLELFEKQIEITKRYRGDANVQYAWLPCLSRTVPGILKYGVGYHHDQLKINHLHGNGIHLIPTNGVRISGDYLDVDENDTRHMILCRVIMGSMELVPCGSNQFLPSSEDFDSGVDRLQNPKIYVVWNMNMNSHIYPECVVSFRVASDIEERVSGDENKLGVLEFSCYKGPQTQILDHTVEATGPKSAWTPFPVLFASIADKVTSESMDLVRTNYAVFKDKKMSRDAFVKKLRLIVGDNILKSAITSLQCQAPHKLSSSNGRAACC